MVGDKFICTNCGYSSSDFEYACFHEKLFDHSMPRVEVDS